MKRLFLLLLAAGVLSACATKKQVAQAPVKRKSVLEAEAIAKRSMIDGVPVEKVEFRPGISSATVERLANAEECRGGRGAGLVTERGPVEIYRMSCANGKVFMARCELRQCKPMNGDVTSR
ncbi:hypothetical protein [Pseudoduganella sp. R-34]|uniref:hypothetical protein n=1 Tax=Pseudoduganella sp. R-34 TaxID=3404062 RepID=UPI003CF8F4A1